MNEENLTYADAMQRLEDISARLENGSVPLEESIALYEESAKLAAFCKQILQQAQMQCIWAAQCLVREHMQII